MKAPDQVGRWDVRAGPGATAWGTVRFAPLLCWEAFSCRASSVGELFPDLGHSEVLRQPGWKPRCWGEGAQITKHQSELLPAGLTRRKLGNPYIHKDAVGRKKYLVSREVPAGPATHCSQQSWCMPILPHGVQTSTDMGGSVGYTADFFTSSWGQPWILSSALSILLQPPLNDKALTITS